MSNSYIIRPARAADLNQLEELLLALQDHVEGANTALWRMRPEGREGMRAQIANRIALAANTAVVAEHAADGVVAIVFGRVVANHRYEPPLAGLVDQLYVRPNHRRRGVASRLIAEICRFFAEQGVGDISLRYAVGNDEATRFWQALGFAPRIVISGAALETIQARLLAGQDAREASSPPS
jgi:GNAT superfamily N-acetyltransferase